MAVEEIYLFTGTEEVRSKTKMERILQSLDLAKTSVTRYDADFMAIQDIIADAITIPFLADMKVIIVKNPRFLTTESSPVKHDASSFIKYLKHPVDTTILMIDAIGYILDKDSEAVKACKKYAYIVDTQDLEGVEYKAWVKRSFVKNNVDIREDALVLLIEYVKNNSLRMEQEIEKLSSYVGQNGRVCEEDVRALVDPDLDNSIFILIKAIVDKDSDAIMRIYYGLEQNTQDVMGIIAMVSKTFVDLLAISKLLKDGYKQGEIANLYNISNGRAYHLVNDAKTFKIEKLEEYVEKMADLDYKIKSNQIDKNLGIEFILLSI